MFRVNKQYKDMNGLDSLKARLNYYGGSKEQRLIKDKLRSLKKAMYSYQGQTAILEDGREFKCLINPNKLNPDYDNKILSIPYKDICLNKGRLGKTSEAEEELGLKPGDVISWKETDTKWIIYLPFLEEVAYFRAEIRKCETQAELNGKKYWIYIRGPVETTIQWNKKHNTVWNDLNNTLVFYITKNEETLDFFHRFKLLKIEGQTWEVQATNTFYGEGIIKVTVKEYYENPLQDYYEEREKENKDNSTIESNIVGDTEVYPYDIEEYSLRGDFKEGTWSINNNKAKIVEVKDNSAIVEVVTGKSGEFILTYSEKDSEKVLTLKVKINSL